MISEFKVNARIRKKIEDSDFEKPIKDLLLKILEIEFKEGGHGRGYSQLYEREIEKAQITLGRQR